MENSGSAEIRLDEITPPRNIDRPKGLWPYAPYTRTRLLADRIVERYHLLAADDALPAGPRTIGYRLSEAFRGAYTKADFENIERVIKRLCQAGDIPFEWVSDASSVDYPPGGWQSPEDFLRAVPGMFRRDLTEGQPVVIEVGTEARETAALIRRVCADSGVQVYSGGGSSGPGLARKVALRALQRAAEDGQDTLLLWLGDFDQAGIKNIVRPHMEHVSAFLYGTSDNKKVLAWEVDGKLVPMAETGCQVTFIHLGLTPEMALARAETAELSQADQDAIAAYAASGTDIWTRDLTLLDGVAKFELEVIDPPEVRNLLLGAFGRLDRAEIDRISADAQIQREDLREDLAPLVGDDDDGDDGEGG